MTRTRDAGCVPKELAKREAPCTAGAGRAHSSANRACATLPTACTVPSQASQNTWWRVERSGASEEEAAARPEGQAAWALVLPSLAALETCLFLVAAVDSSQRALWPVARTRAAWRRGE